MVNCHFAGEVVEMPPRLLQRLMPTPDRIKKQGSLRFMAPLLADPRLWLLTRRSVANAMSIGLFCAMLPIPFQMAVAAVAARISRANLALSVGLVWVTNPLTMPLIFYAQFRLGAFFLDTPVWDPPSRISTRWMAEQLQGILPSLLLGAILMAIALGILGNVCVRLIWRWHVSRQWVMRRQRYRRRDVRR